MATKAHKLLWPEDMINRLGGALEPVTEDCFSSVNESCQTLGLTEDTFQDLYSVYLQIASWINSYLESENETKLVGINGAQGTGKSTAAFIIKNILEACYKKKVCVLSLDDFYYTRAERAKLAREVHPLLVTRGVPGTHDIDLGMSIIHDLINADHSSKVKIPIFDKANDERKREDQWLVYDGRPDIVILEGWCVSAKPQPVESLTQPINELERLNDHDGVWRNYVNQQLLKYQALFDQIQLLIMLKVPAFKYIYEWRLLQEKKLKKSVLSDNRSANGIMDEEQIRGFIEHFERLTRWMLEEMVDRADLVLAINEAHEITEVILKSEK